MKKIDISTKKHPNTFALVDDGDYEKLNRHKWYATEPYEGKIYAHRRQRIDDKTIAFHMHVVIIGKVEGKITDHRNGNGLDNQRHNLRHCTHKENIRNQGINVANTSGYKGVCWNRWRNKWQSNIKYNNKTLHLGLFTCLIKAAKAYDKAAKKYHGEFANLNFKDE